MIKIFEITEADDETLDAVNRLLPQLSKSSKLINRSTLQKLSNSECTRLYVAKEDDTIFGMLSLVVFSIPTGTKAWIEDVVVDERARGKGVGRELMNHALNVAKELGAKSADLTSRPSREAANKLYQAIGFEGRETNVYRFSIS
ncbi:MAG: GNAT family N-acetyltransferase [Opitutales bacterium]|nr:GNAT family N-acetyltransferase [Opitutales bacterium]